MHSSSLIFSTAALALAALPAAHAHVAPRQAAANYCLQDNLEGNSFFDAFDFATEDDLTWGYVDYVNRANAFSSGLARVDNNGQAYIGVETTPNIPAGARGRKSVRLEGKKQYNHGLFIIDLEHMPGGVCGTWPAFWTLGTGGDWPENGEIDIIEGVNNNNVNRHVLHSEGQCSVANSGATGQLLNPQCAVSAGPEGCAVDDRRTNSFGSGFNSNRGGVYAMEWTSSAIKMWFFPRGSVPTSITAGSPQVSQFGTPVANFQPACGIDNEFKNQRMMINTNFCGDWAGNVYGDSSCPSLVSGGSSMENCRAFVQNTGSAFSQAYWLFNSVKVYQTCAPPSSSQSSAPTTPSPIPSASGNVTTVVTTTYVTDCPEGLTTITATKTITYCPTCTRRPASSTPQASKPAPTGPVVSPPVTGVPSTNIPAPPTGSPSVPVPPGSSPAPPASSPAPPASSPAPPASSPAPPASSPVSPTSSPAPSTTSPLPPVFTGAAAPLNVAGVLEMVGVAAVGALLL